MATPGHGHGNRGDEHEMMVTKSQERKRRRRKQGMDSILRTSHPLQPSVEPSFHLVL
jgi:hypothetical protein